jgi:hypothetical protein
VLGRGQQREQRDAGDERDRAHARDEELARLAAAGAGERVDEESAEHAEPDRGDPVVA